ncbi:MAG: hypothetical protein ACE5R4_12115 [Armatimonadota bacterium]
MDPIAALVGVGRDDTRPGAWPPQAPEWLAATPEGYYDCSNRVTRLITWRVGDELLPVHAYEDTYHRPDLVARALRGETVAPE